MSCGQLGGGQQKAPLDGGALNRERRCDQASGLPPSITSSLNFSTALAWLRPVHFELAATAFTTVREGFSSHTLSRGLLFRLQEWFEEGGTHQVALAGK